MVKIRNGKYKNKLEFELKLIKEIEKRPCLFSADKKSINNYCKTIAWNEIQEFLGQSVEICKRIWNNLKTNFKKYHKVDLEKSQDISWVHYESLKSLLEVASPISSINKINIKTDEIKQKNAEIDPKTENSFDEIYKKCGEIMISNTNEFKFICWTCQEQCNNIDLFIVHVLRMHIDFDTTVAISSKLNYFTSSCSETDSQTHNQLVLEISKNEVEDIQLRNITKNCEELNQKTSLSVSKEQLELNDKDKTKKLKTKLGKAHKSKQGIFPCEQCDRIFEYQSQLYRHKRLHTGERPYKCEVCDQSYRHHRNLKDHFSICHTEERPFACRHEGCVKKFKTVRIRKLHETLHTNDLPFQCQDCGKCFPQNSYLITHRNTWHVDKKDRRHKCEHCEKTFYSKQNLKFHIYTHTGERPYGCPICPTRFTKPWSVKEHMKIHSGERNYVCKICEKGFNQIAGLIKHKKRHEDTMLEEL